jgi:hypothetical protein
VATAALAARALGLPGLDPLRASLSTTKAGFAELCAEAGVAAPATTVLDDAGGPEELPGDGPIVFKPSDGAVGKHGDVRAASRAERAAAYERARAASRDGVVVAQEFVAGDDFALVALFHAGATRVVASLDERVRFGADGEARGAGVDVPSRLAGSPAFDAARAATERLARALGTGVGFFAFRAPTSTEAAPRAIEAHLDLGGDFVSDVLLARGAGVDLAGLALALHLERALPAPRAMPGPRPARLTFLYEEDRPRLAELMARGEGVFDLPPIGRHGGGRMGWLLEARP